MFAANKKFICGTLSGDIFSDHFIWKTFSGDFIYTSINTE